MDVKLSQDEKIRIGSPEDIYDVMQRLLLRESRISQEKEHFWVLGLDSNNKITYIELLSLGNITTAIINPLEVFNLAVRKKSPKIILVHNHPNESVDPTPEDIRITNKVVDGGNTLTIKVLDHLIISKDSYYSFADNNLL